MLGLLMPVDALLAPSIGARRRAGNRRLQRRGVGAGARGVSEFSERGVARAAPKHGFDLAQGAARRPRAPSPAPRGGPPKMPAPPPASPAGPP
jgi:hypothetical protein